MKNKTKKDLIGKRDQLIKYTNVLSDEIINLNDRIGEIDRNECKFSNLIPGCEGCHGGTNNGKGCNIYKMEQAKIIIAERMAIVGPTCPDSFCCMEADVLISLFETLEGK